MVVTQATRASDFVNSIGVNTHVSYYNTLYANISNVVADLDYLGIDHVRDSAPVWAGSEAWFPSYEIPMAAGIKFDLTIPANALDVQADLTVIDALETLEPGDIDAVEGVNEASPSLTYEGLTGEAAANAFQAQLFAAVQQDPQLAGVQVYNYTAGTNPYDPSTYTQFGNISAEATDGNAHAYSGYQAPSAGDFWFLSEQLAGTPDDPFVVTETGYDTMPGMDTDGSQGVNDDVQAKYTLDDIVDLVKAGASMVYIYELLDEWPDPNMTDHEFHFGFFNSDNTPKEAAVALHDLTTILADAGATASSFSPGALAYSLSNLPSTGNAMLLEKSNGSFYLAVWAEPEIWDPTTLQEITVAATPVTVNLGQVAGSVEIYDPLVGTAPIAAYDSVSQVTLSITDHPLIVEIDMPASLSGNVTLNGAEEAGVAVSLLSGGTLVATTVTDGTGAFSFTGLAAGSYQVQYTAPPGTVLAAGSAANIATGLTQAITLAAGQMTDLPAEALQPAPSVITGKALHFGAATDPWYGSGDAGVAVSLLTAAGSVIADAVSNATGWFAFSSVAPGTYQLRYTAPAGQAFVGGASGLTAPFTVAAGQVVAAPNGDLLSLATLSGSVTLAGVAAASVVVSLANSAGVVRATTTTNSAGNFTFADLAAGSYEVKYAAPSGAVLAIGGPANPSTGTSAAVTLSAGQTLTLPTEAMLTQPSVIAGKALHFGGVNDPSYGGGDGGVTVSLLNASGTLIARATTISTGYFAFTDIAPGSYQVLYTLPPGQAFEPGTPGLTAAFAVGSGATVYAPSGALMSALVMDGDGLTVSESAGSYVVTGTTSNSTLTLGNGNQTVTLAGIGNTITVGTGTSTITAGTGGDTVHAAGGHVSISATGTGNLFDAGGGMSFLYADGSAGNIFATNAAASGTLTTISGFNPTDTLDLQRTLANSTIEGNLGNIASYITSSVSNGNTILSVDPTGGHGTAVPFAVLTGVQTSVAALQAAQSFSLS